MAIENVIKLMQAAQEKPELAAKLETVTSSEQVVEIGASEGLEFTTEEVEDFRQKLEEAGQKTENDELSEDQLESVAGGWFGERLWNNVKNDFNKTIANSGLSQIGNTNVITGLKIIGGAPYTQDPKTGEMKLAKK